MASVAFTPGKKYMLDNGLTGKTLRAMLMVSTYTPDPDHDFVNDVSASEISGPASYARKTLTTVAVVADLAGEKFYVDCDDIAWGNLESGVTPGYVLIYVQIGGNDASPADDPILCACQFTATPTNGQAYTTTIPSNGFLGD